MRDLNHHIPAYRQIARITYAGWVCRFNNCCQTVDGTGLQRKFPHLYGKIPATWIIAQSLLSATEPKLCLRLTDSSYILNGEVSISHVLNICKAHNLQIFDGVALKCLARVGVTKMKQTGSWKKNPTGKWAFVKNEKPAARDERWTAATNRSWDRAIQMLTNTCME